MAVSETTRTQMREIVARYPRQRSALMPLAASGAGGRRRRHHSRASPKSPRWLGSPKRKSRQSSPSTRCTSSGRVASIASAFASTRSAHSSVVTRSGTPSLTIAAWAMVETTADGKVTLERIECQAACTHAPVMTADWEFLDDMTVSKAVEVVDELRAGEHGREYRGPSGSLLQGGRAHHRRDRRLVER